MRFAVVGHPIGHSLSPPMHRAAFANAGISAIYEALSVPPDQFAERIGQLRDGFWSGFNVTVPHKVAALQMADEPDSLAERTGAANTLWRRDGRISATNTDVVAMTGIIAASGVPKTAEVVLVGAGGAARAALVALSGFGRLTILNRTVANAETLIVGFAPGARVLSLGDPAAAEAARGASLIINSSIVGMAGGPAESRSPLPADSFGPHQVVLDMVYRPLLTPMLASAQAAGARTIDGLTMLVLQGAASFKVWTGIDPDQGLMRRACEHDL